MKSRSSSHTTVTYLHDTKSNETQIKMACDDELQVQDEKQQTHTNPSAKESSHSCEPVTQHETKESELVAKEATKMDSYTKKIATKLTPWILTKDYNHNVNCMSSLKAFKYHSCHFNHNSIKLNYELTFDLDYDTIIKNSSINPNAKKSHGNSRSKITLLTIHKKLSETLGVPCELIDFIEYKRGSLKLYVGVAVFVAAFGMVSYSMLQSRVGDPNGKFEVGNRVNVSYIGRAYECKVTEFISNDGTFWKPNQVKVHYINDPFWFNNDETLLVCHGRILEKLQQWN